MLSRPIGTLFYFYNLLILIRIFLTWIPNIDWDIQPYKWMRSVTDPVLNIFRGIIPPIGGVLDISPVIVLILLQLVQAMICGTLQGLGL